MTRQRHGNAPLTSSICVAMAPGGRYEGRYSRATLADWGKLIQAWHGDLCDVYVYFDNDQKSAAPMDALALLPLLTR